jgi:serine phosphatase RsbU (regulator of sigma subunit)
MTAVAGDFYDFVPVDKNRVGFLIADVSDTACQLP